MMAFSRIVNCHTEEDYEKVFKKAGEALVLVEFVAVSEVADEIPRKTFTRWNMFFTRKRDQNPHPPTGLMVPDGSLSAGANCTLDTASPRSFSVRPLSTALRRDGVRRARACSLT